MYSPGDMVYGMNPEIDCADSDAGHDENSKYEDVAFATGSEVGVRGRHVPPHPRHGPTVVGGPIGLSGHPATAEAWCTDPSGVRGLQLEQSYLCAMGGGRSIVCVHTVQLSQLSPNFTAFTVAVRKDAVTLCPWQPRRPNNARSKIRSATRPFWTTSRPNATKLAISDACPIHRFGFHASTSSSCKYYRIVMVGSNAEFNSRVSSAGCHKGMPGSVLFNPGTILVMCGCKNRVNLGWLI